MSIRLHRHLRGRRVSVGVVLGTKYSPKFEFSLNVLGFFEPKPEKLHLKGEKSPLPDTPLFEAIVFQEFSFDFFNSHAKSPHFVIVTCSKI